MSLGIDFIDYALEGNYVLAISSIAAALIVIFVFSPLHEFAHAWSSYKLGDGTAKMMGRLSLNPMKHIDWLGAAMIMLFGFGWARPVPVNMRNFNNPKWGMALTALAGPTSNLIAGFLCRVICHILIAVLSTMTAPNLAVLNVMLFFVKTFEIMSLINVGLAVFNLIPIPPLDGSRILTAILPDRIYYKIMQYEQIIMMGLMLVIFLGVLSGPLIWAQRGILQGFDSLIMRFIH